MEAHALKKPRITPANKPYSDEKISGQIICAKIHEPMAPIKPPIKPAILLFGLAAKTLRLFFPKRTPNNDARESFINTVKRNKARNFVDSANKVIREMNVSKNPQ